MSLVFSSRFKVEAVADSVLAQQRSIATAILLILKAILFALAGPWEFNLLLDNLCSNPPCHS